MTDLFECRKCGVAQGPHRYHQKNRDGGLSRHKYCKDCRKASRLEETMALREARAAASAILNERWVFLRPLLAEDFKKGESIADMKKRMGINLASFHNNK